ncbi:MAG: hypothetical protein KDI13_10390 [Alphaproteobacteria bacterium]|nr:hypothetical protein [Alphaproteobacteria bacterium]
MTGVSTLGQALRQIENIKNQQTAFNTLSSQLTTGKKSLSFTGLGTDTLASTRARTSLSSLSVYASNIDRADLRINLMLNSVEEFQSQTGNISSALVNFLQEGVHQKGATITYDDPSTPEVEETPVGMTSAESDNDLQSLIDIAGNLYDFMISLLNTKDGDRYIFGGAETLTKPLNDGGTLDAAMSSLITNWKSGSITTDELIADLTDRTATNGNADAITDTLIGYSSSLSSGTAGKVFVRADKSAELDYTTLANDQSFRDIIVALSFLKNENLPPIADVYEDGVYPGTPDAQGAPGADIEEMKENFYAVFNKVVSMVDSAIDNIDSTRFNLESVRAQMKQIADDQTNQKTLLLNVVSDIEDVDVNEVAVKINALQVQIQTSYSVTALASQLSLVNFL